jgi:hypothetical protein
VADKILSSQSLKIIVTSTAERNWILKREPEYAPAHRERTRPVERLEGQKQGRMGSEGPVVDKKWTVLVLANKLRHLTSHALLKLLFNLKDDLGETKNVIGGWTARCPTRVRLTNFTSSVGVLTRMRSRNSWETNAHCSTISNYITVTTHTSNRTITLNPVMVRRSTIHLLLLFMAGLLQARAADDAAKAGVAIPMPQQFTAAPQPAGDDSPKADPAAVAKWQAMRFGMFIHWGPVSLTGHEIGWSRSVAHELSMARVHRGRELLSEKILTVKEAGYAAGFGGSRRFISAHRWLFGTTPGLARHQW